jgi:hypothetical protein
MSEQTETTQKKRKAPPAAWKPGESGNPNGRPPGSTLHGALRSMVKEHWEPIVRALIEKAEQGDTQAASLLLTRVSPTLRPIQEPVRVNVTGETLTEKAASILDAVTKGELSPSDGKMLLDGLGAICKIQEVDELVKRIEALEAKQS